ncbi:Ribonuclease H [Abeliophyllum distichum]|uniref:Ribonuclease H n=1 Tax=Abeliophyllum distichum TaxID=126358 RepID=A0ABD1VWE9_9LAMI
MWETKDVTQSKTCGKNVFSTRKSMENEHSMEEEKPSQDDPRERPLPAWENWPVPTASVFDRLGVGCSPSGSDSLASLAEELEVFPVNPLEPTQELKVGEELEEKMKEELKQFIRENIDIFAWKHSDMVGINPSMACHALNVDPKVRSKIQKRRPLSAERYGALKEEVDKLMMLFSLKNTGATYQRLVNRMFAGQIGNNMEVYVNDILLKCVNVEDHIGHLKGMFGVLCKYHMKLNLLKCAFGVASGKFIGYMVNTRKIEANPKDSSTH